MESPIDMFFFTAELRLLKELKPNFYIAGLVPERIPHIDPALLVSLNLSSGSNEPRVRKCVSTPPYHISTPMVDRYFGYFSMWLAMACIVNGFSSEYVAGSGILSDRKLVLA